MGASDGRPLRIQAGAFASLGNAQRAVAMLAPAGRAVVEATLRGQRTLYRVSLAASSNRGAAQALRVKVAELGFADAMILIP
jgi:rare lipoprotein A